MDTPTGTQVQTHRYTWTQVHRRMCTHTDTPTGTQVQTDTQGHIQVHRRTCTHTDRHGHTYRHARADTHTEIDTHGHTAHRHRHIYTRTRIGRHIGVHTHRHRHTEARTAGHRYTRGSPLPAAPVAGTSMSRSWARRPEWAAGEPGSTERMYCPGRDLSLCRLNP